MEGAARALACMAPMAARVWSTLCPILRRCCGESTRSRTQAPQAACWRRQGWLHCIQYVLFENAMGVVKLWAVVAGAPRAPQRAHGAVHESPMPGRRVWTPTLSLRTHTGYGLAPCCPPCMRGPLADNRCASQAASTNTRSTRGTLSAPTTPAACAGMLDLRQAQEWVVTTKLGASDRRPGTQVRAAAALPSHTTCAARMCGEHAYIATHAPGPCMTSAQALVWHA